MWIRALGSPFRYGKYFEKGRGSGLNRIWICSLRQGKCILLHVCQGQGGIPNRPIVFRDQANYLKRFDQLFLQVRSVVHGGLIICLWMFNLLSVEVWLMCIFSKLSYHFSFSIAFHYHPHGWLDGQRVHLNLMFICCILNTLYFNLSLRQRVLSVRIKKVP